MAVPALSELCLETIARNIRRLSGSLSALSLELGEVLLRKLWLHDVDILRAFAWAFWRPVRLSLQAGMALSASSVRHLQLYSTSLVKLDLSGCTWLTSLQGLQGEPSQLF